MTFYPQNPRRPAFTGSGDQPGGAGSGAQGPGFGPPLLNSVPDPVSSWLGFDPFAPPAPRPDQILAGLVYPHLLREMQVRAERRAIEDQYADDNSGDDADTASDGSGPADVRAADTAAGEQPKRYEQGGLGADWHSAFTPQGFEGMATEPRLAPPGQPLDTRISPPSNRQPPPPTSTDSQPPRFRRPNFTLPDALQIAASQNTAGTDADESQSGTESDKRFDTIWPFIQIWEDGYSINPKDPGGETKFGVSRKFLDAHNLQIGSIKDMMEEQASNIIKRHLYYGCNIALLPPALQPQVLDASVLGENRGIRVLQQVLNDMSAKDSSGNALTVDGGIGKDTLDAVAAVEARGPAAMRDLRDRYADKLKTGYTQFAEKHKNLKRFLPGWLDRTHYFQQLEFPP